METGLYYSDYHQNFYLVINNVIFKLTDRNEWERSTYSIFEFLTFETIFLDNI